MVYDGVDLKRHCVRCGKSIETDSLICPVCHQLSQPIGVKDRSKESTATSQGPATADLVIQFVESEQNSGFIKCVWELKLRDMSLWNRIWNIKEWADANHRLRNRCQPYVMKREDRIYHLVIQGRGQDGRCAWCRAFRSTISKDFSEKHLRCEESGACIFEQ